jgi:CBS domain-containing protein
MNDRIGTVLDQKARKVECTQVSTTVFDAVTHMNAERIGALVVTDGEQIVGIFTERDVLVRVIAKGRDPHVTAVGDVMTRDPITIQTDTTVAEAMMVITENRCRHLPVVDHAHLCGLISIGDLTSWLVHDQRLTIEDLHNYIRAA